MANLRRWMAQARTLEEAGDLEGAIALYRKALVAQEETTGFADLGLSNALGDLFLRAGQPERAVEEYERAAAHCEQQQLYANGIALCKKILRNAPEHTAVYRRVGRLFALSGLETDARASYARYVERCREAGNPAEALAARVELAELISATDIALEAADELAAAVRFDDALALLEGVGSKREREGRDIASITAGIEELRATVDAAADPVRTSGGGATADPLGASEEPDPDALTEELHRILSRLDGEDRYRHALPIIDHLLEIDPDRFELLRRKLEFAFALGDEEALVSAYLALGDYLDRNLESFKLRSMSSATENGVTAAIRVDRAEPLAPRS